MAFVTIPPKVRRSRSQVRAFAVFTAVFLTIVFSIQAQAVDPSAYRRQPMPQRVVVPDGAYLVKYQVESTDGSNVTLTVGGATHQREVLSGVRSFKFAASPGEILYESVQNKRDHGAVACRIWVDGQLVQSATSDVAYGIASCSAQVPR